MGFAAVLYLDHPSPADLDPDLLVGSLLEVLGTDPYPTAATHPTAAAPWLCAGSWHSTLAVRVFADAGPPALLRPAEPGDTSTGPISPTLTAAEVGTATDRFLATRPLRAARISSPDEIFGPDPLAETTAAGSLWWFHMDALGALRERADADEVKLAAELVEAHLDRTAAGVSVLQYMNALCCAARLGPQSRTVAELSGNRLRAVTT